MRFMHDWSMQLALVGKECFSYMQCNKEFSDWKTLQSAIYRS